jgi:hypothetical protein
MTSEHKNMELMQTLDDARDIQSSGSGGLR